jgi:exodeoxyribonuclease V gamma subunit
MLHVHRAERADRLAGALGELLAEPSPDPFAREVVAVTTRGVERWLSQTLAARLGATSGRDGVCANVAFPFPGRVIAGAVAVASGIEPDTDPWLLERTVWPLLETVEACAGEPWLAALSEHLESAPGRRFARVRVIAGLFDGYQVRRPALIDAWARGGGDERSWQPRLWRALRARIGMPSPAERLAGACTRLRDHPDLLDLPARLSLFGLTRMAPSHLGVLDALAAGRDVHLMLLHPSPALWERVSGPAACRHIYVPADGPAIVRALDPTVALPRNRLLASWGRESRELQLVLGGRGVDLHHPLDVPVRSSPTLLTTLQADIRADRQPPGSPLPGAPEERLVLTPADESVRIHACHGRHRQVEVLREAILHRLAADPTLEPRDVIVMCPDIETFAPLIQATFGTTHAADSAPVDEPDEWSRTDLRVRLADRSLRQTNPVLGVDRAAARARRAAPDRLAGARPRRHRAGPPPLPVRRRRPRPDPGLDRRGGNPLGARRRHRGPFKLAEVEAGTWARGCAGLLLGVALARTDQRCTPACCRSTTSRATRSSSPAGSPSCSARLGEALDSLLARRRSAAGRRRWPGPPTR